MFLPMHSTVNAFGSVHPYIQEPLNASQYWFLQLTSQVSLQLLYLFVLQPGNS